MFERVIAQTIQRITTDVLRERSSISLVEILEEERIPARLKPFFETEVQWWLYNEMLARAANKRFNYDHPELASLLNYLEQVQFRHARFEREDFLTVLDSAVKLTYNFLCRPQTTLKWYIFRGQPVKPLREVMLRFGAFLDYGYFRNVFSEWVERKQHERPTFDGISSTEFERVIRRIDDQILLNCTVEDLLAILNPIFEFIGEGEEMQVPIDALIIFFDDKNIKKLVDYLERSREGGRETVSRDDFVALLDELLSSSEEEPEADFSDVYQNDELDDVVRRHLQSEGKAMIAGGPEFPQVDLSDEVEVDGRMPEVSNAMPEATPQYQYQTGEREQPPGIDTGGWISPEQHRSFTEAFGASSAQTARQEVEATERIGDMANRREEGGIGEMKETEIEPSPALYDDAALEESTMAGDEEAGPAAGASLDDTTKQNGTTARVTEESPVVDRAVSGTTIHAAERRVDDTADTYLSEDDEEEDEEEDDLPSFSGAGQSPSDRPVPNSDPARYGQPSERSLEDVRRFIDPMLERKVLKRIFDKDRVEYESALDRLNASDNWRAASQVLDELFSRHGVDPYSRTAIRFTDSVYGRYLPR
jgi:hypothetical protein